MRVADQFVPVVGQSHQTMLFEQEGMIEVINDSPFGLYIAWIGGQFFMPPGYVQGVPNDNTGGGLMTISCTANIVVNQNVSPTYTNLVTINTFNKGELIQPSYPQIIIRETQPLSLTNNQVTRVSNGDASVGVTMFVSSIFPAKTFYTTGISISLARTSAATGMTFILANVGDGTFATSIDYNIQTNTSSEKFYTHNFPQPLPPFNPNNSVSFGYSGVSATGACTIGLYGYYQ